MNVTKTSTSGVKDLYRNSNQQKVAFEFNKRKQKQMRKE